MDYQKPKKIRFEKKSRRLPEIRRADPFGNGRSALMAKIRSGHTNFETAIFYQLRSSGVTFESHCREVPGKPDLVIPKKRKAVFLDSDFWHGWRYPTWKKALKNDFWRNKIESNRKRDIRVKAKLRRQGWQVLRVWEHQLGRDFDGSLKEIRGFLLK